MSAFAFLPRTFLDPSTEVEQASPEVGLDPSMAIQSAGGGGNSWLADLLGFGGKKAEAAPEAAAVDPAVEADKAAMADARAKLADKFQVVGDDFGGPRASNQLSPEEFEQMARMYADIGQGKTLLQLDTEGLNKEDAEKFKSGAMGDISTLMQTQSGRELIEKLAYDNKGLDGTAHVTKLSSLAPDVSGERAKCKTPLDQVGKDFTPAGADSQVWWHPGQTVNVEGHDEPFRSDVILYHELVHALHQGRGTTASGEVNPIHPNDTGISQSEYQASGLGHDDDHEHHDPMADLFNENLYRRERAALGEDVGERKKYRGKDPFAQ